MKKMRPCHVFAGLVLGVCPNSGQPTTTPEPPCAFSWSVGGGDCCRADDDVLPFLDRTYIEDSPDDLVELLISKRVNFSQPSSAVATIPEIPLNIYLKTIVKRVHSVSQKSQTVGLSFEHWWNWRDCRLVWKSPQATGPLVLTESHSAFSHFWLPSPVFLQRSPNLDKETLSEFIYLLADGSVVLRQTRNQIFSCTFDFENMPFDVQKCTFTVLVPAYDTHQLTLDWGAEDDIRGRSFMMDDLSHSEWTIADVEEVRKTQERGDISLGMNQLEVSSLSFTLTLTRKSYDFVQAYFIPALCYWFCSYAGCYIDAGAVPARSALGLIPILTLNNKITSLRQTLPPINKQFKCGDFMDAFFYLTIGQLVLYCVINWAARYVKTSEKPADLEAAGDDASKKSAGATVHLCLYKFASWAQTGIDFHCRWMLPVLAGLITLFTLRPWE